MTEIPVQAKDKESYTSELVIGLLAGGLAGSVAALWNAPCAGDELLQRVQGWFQRKADRVSNAIQGDSIDDALHEGRAIAHQHRAEHAERLPPPPID